MGWKEFFRPTWRKIIILVVLNILTGVLYWIGCLSIFGLGSCMVLVKTNSMSPSYNAGDVVFVKKVSSAEVNANDVIVFKPSMPEYKDIFIVARVISIDQGKGVFTTKGDSNPFLYLLKKTCHYRISMAKLCFPFRSWGICFFGIFMVLLFIFLFG